VLIFIITFFIYKHYGNKLKNGFLLGLTMVLLIIARFVLEFFKMPQAHYSTGLDMSVGQLLSIPYLIAGLAFIYFALRKDKKQ
jgi:prolipoprotein diacylglyceryltransferase